MALFAPGNRNKSSRHKKIYAAYEMAFTAVDFTAAFSFIVGSFLFFFPEYETAAIWFFVAGSVFFALKPTIRLAREIHYIALGEIDDVAEKLTI